MWTLKSGPGRILGVIQLVPLATGLTSIGVGAGGIDPPSFKFGWDNPRTFQAKLREKITQLPDLLRAVQCFTFSVVYTVRVQN